jgi:hypothetical protein
VLMGLSFWIELLSSSLVFFINGWPFNSKFQKYFLKLKAISSKERFKFFNYQFLGLVVLGFMRPINFKLKAGNFISLARTSSKLGLGFRPFSWSHTNHIKSCKQFIFFPNWAPPLKHHQYKMKGGRKHKLSQINVFNSFCECYKF